MIVKKILLFYFVTGISIPLYSIVVFHNKTRYTMNFYYKYLDEIGVERVFKKPVKYYGWYASDADKSSMIKVSYTAEYYDPYEHKKISTTLKDGTSGNKHVEVDFDTIGRHHYLEMSFRNIK